MPENTDYPFDDIRLINSIPQLKRELLPKQDVLKFTTEVQPIGKQQYMELSKDIFVFSYLCGGINFTDIANLTKENIQNGQITLYSSKNKRN